MKKIFLLVLAMVAISAVSASAADIAGQFGILDVTANDGINPATGAAWAVGDTYRLIFVTSGTTQATSTDIATYNAFVQGIADAAGLGSVTWKMVGSTATVDAKDNTGTNPDVDGIGEAILLMNGTSVIADNYADLWDGINVFDGDVYGESPDDQGRYYTYGIHLDENGVKSLSDRIFTGSNPNGTASSDNDRVLGGSAEDPAQVQTGRNHTPEGYYPTWKLNGNAWMVDWREPTTVQKKVYAISEPLTVKSAYIARIVYPAYGDDEVEAVNPLTLEWINPDPNGNGSVYADVWFGTDPCALSPIPTVPTDGLDVTSAEVDASAAGTYYWRVDITVGDSNTVTGDIWNFTTTTDIAPTVTIDDAPTMTWSDKPVQILATVDDNGEGDTTFVWTASPDGSGNDDLTVDFDANAEDPEVKVTNNTGETVTVIMTLTATDAAGPVSVSTSIDVYADACEMAKHGEGIAVPPSDINADCITDIKDLAIVAAGWLIDYSSTSPQ